MISQNNETIMNKVLFLFITGILLITSQIQATDGDYYQIKIYSIETEQQELRMDNFLKEAYLPALHRAGIKHVGVFKPVDDEEKAGKLIYVLIPLNSIAQIETLDAVLNTDKKFLKLGEDYVNAEHDNPPYSRIQSIILKAFSSFPEYGVPDHDSNVSERIYELRSYQASTERLYQKKVEMFNEGKESKLFVDLGFQPIFFGEVLSGSTMPNLMYLITYKNKESQQKHWDSFVNSPEWTVLKSDEQYKNTVSKIVKILLHPTVYSDL